MNATMKMWQNRFDRFVFPIVKAVKWIISPFRSLPRYNILDIMAFSVTCVMILFCLGGMYYIMTSPNSGLQRHQTATMEYIEQEASKNACVRETLTKRAVHSKLRNMDVHNAIKECTTEDSQAAQRKLLEGMK